MSKSTRPGVVIFTGDKERLVAFYRAITGLSLHINDTDVAVLASDEFELVIHALVDEPLARRPPFERSDVYIKPFFPVPSLADTREKAHLHGGQLMPKSEEWEARGFRACEAVDPDGNVIQVREQIS